MGKVKLFWFSVLALRVGKNQMCLTVRLAFFKLGITPSYDEWGLEITKFAIRTQPQQLINLHIVADFPSTSKLL
jgi:hypothetical protein